MLPILFTIPKFKVGPLSLGPMAIHTYGVMIVVSFMAGMWLVRRRAKLYGFNPDKVFPTPRLCGDKPGPYVPHPTEISGEAGRG